MNEKSGQKGFSAVGFLFSDSLLGYVSPTNANILIQSYFRAMPETSRLFFALWPDDDTRQAIVGLSHVIGAKDFKGVQPYNLHVTLVFLGQVDKETDMLIRQSVADLAVQPFTLSFDSLSYWKIPGILCLTSQQPVPKEAMILTAALKTAVEKYGLQTDARPYIPHITLARHAWNLPDVQIEPINWRSEAFCLVESCSEPEGVFYKVRERWSFVKPVTNAG
jgi:2'-5' RNA ligase